MSAIIGNTFARAVRSYVLNVSVIPAQAGIQSSAELGRVHFVHLLPVRRAHPTFLDSRLRGNDRNKLGKV